MALRTAHRLIALTKFALPRSDDDEISTISNAPSLRIEMVSSTLRSNTSWHYCGILIIPCSTGPPHDGTRQQDQVGWSEGGPHIVIRQYTFCRRLVGAGRLQTHGGTVNIAN